jgi:hypothetical protein
MRLSIASLPSLVATALMLAAGTGAEAAVFGGQTVSTGVIRCATGASQTSDAFTLEQSVLQIDHCSGMTEFVPIVAVSATQFEAVGTYGRLDGYVAGATNTTMKFTLHTPGDDVAAIRIVGNADSSVAFDRRLPSPGTPGSGLGVNVTPISMIGVWTAYAHLTDQVALCPAAPQGDLFMTMILKFTTCFRYGDYISWRVDTDKVG